MILSFFKSQCFILLFVYLEVTQCWFFSLFVISCFCHGIFVVWIMLAVLALRPAVKKRRMEASFPVPGQWTQTVSSSVPLTGCDEVAFKTTDQRTRWMGTHMHVCRRGTCTSSAMWHRPAEVFPGSWSHHSSSHCKVFSKGLMNICSASPPCSSATIFERLPDLHPVWWKVTAILMQIIVYVL